MKCIPGEKILAMATLFAIELSSDMDPNDTLAWSDFFGVVTAGLIAIANRKLYITSPEQPCHHPPSNTSLPNKPNQID